MDTYYIIYKIMRITKWGRKHSTAFFLSKYLYILDLVKKEIENSPQKRNSNQVWTMWLQEEVPPICQMCINTIKKFHPNTIVITEKNLDQYVQVPDYIYKKYKKGEMLPAHFSDFIRVCLLDKYGGTWIDATCFMTNQVPKYITKSKFFILKNFDGSAVSNYFIHSETNNFIIKALKIFLLEYWKKEEKAIGYFFFHNFLCLISRKNNTAKIMYEDIPISLNWNTKLMAKLLYKPIDKDVFNWLAQTSFLHKLSYKKKDNIEITPDCLYSYLIKEYS